MTFLLVLGVVSVIGVAGTAVLLTTDGYGPVRTEWTRLPDRILRAECTICRRVHDDATPAGRALGGTPCDRQQ